MNSNHFKLLKLYRAYSISFSSSNVGNFFWSWKDCHRSSGTESRRLVFTSFTKREIRRFHIALVQWRQRNVQFCQSKPTVFLFAVLVDVAVAVAQLSNEVLWPKQQLCTCITFFSTFLWRPLHYCDVKPPNATLYGGRGHTTTKFPLSISTWIKPLRIQLQEKLGFQIDAIKFERTQIHSFGNVFTAAAVVVVA